MGSKEPRNTMRKVAEGIYVRNGIYVIPIYNSEKKGRDTHPMSGKRCPVCKRVHERPTGTERQQIRAAARLKDQLEQEKERSQAIRSEKTVDEWVGHYDEGQWVQGEWLKLMPRKSESTNMHNDSRVRAFARYFEGSTLAGITEEQASEFAAEHGSTLKEVHSCMNDAVAKRFIDRNPFAGIRMPARRGRQDIVVLKEHELEQLVGIARAIHGSFGPMFGAMIQTAAWTGLRPGELFLLSLEPADRLNFVDFDANRVYVNWQHNQKTKRVTRPKNGTQRQVPLLPGARDALSSIKSWEAGQPIFTTKRGRPFTQRAMFNYWSPVRAAFVASLPAGHPLRVRQADAVDRGEHEAGNMDFYELRHFFGTKLAFPPAGVPAASQFEIASMMGHADNGRTALKYYIHPDNEDAATSVFDAWAKKAS